MKFEVIGWTNFEDERYPVHEGDHDAVDGAVAEAIRAGGYRFGGDSHQGGDTCTPVLNDGTRAIYSFREWGYIMADALSLYTQNGPDYMEWYMDLEKVLMGDVELVFPPAGVDKRRIRKRAELAEDFTIRVSPAELEAVRAGRKTAEIRTREDGFERVCKGDFLLYESGGNSCRVRVNRAEAFASFAELFGKTEDRRELRRRNSIIGRALYEGCDRAALYDMLAERYPNGNQALYTAVVFLFSHPIAAKSS